MKILKYQYLREESYGVYKQGVIYPIKGDIFNSFEIVDDPISENDVRIVVPLTPGKIIAVGLNYSDHAGEFDFNLPEEPITFMVTNTAVIGPEEEIKLTSPGGRVDFEGELVIIMGKECSKVSQENALDFVLGYTCGNDVSDRHVQKRDGQWTRAKSYPTYKPLGPWIETEVDPDNLSIKTIVNGEIKQDSNTNNMAFSTATLVSFISNFTTLFPGDAIYTGTPEGVGPLKHDDIVEIQIEGVGILKNKVVKL